MQILGLALLLVAGWSAAAGYEIDWFTVDGGGWMWCAGGDFELSGTIGQPDASTTVMTGGDFALVGGFWTPGEEPGPGDCDEDGDVDLDDYAFVADCLLGPDAELGDACACVDLDGDGDADLADVALFQQGFDGP